MKYKGTKNSVCNDCFDDGFKGAPCPHIELNTQEIQEDEIKIKSELNSILWNNTDVQNGNYPMKGQLKADLEEWVFRKLAEQEARHKREIKEYQDKINVLNILSELK